ncbi:MAG: DUF58 domain-containing protein [Planctomycetota bacterium]
MTSDAPTTDRETPRGLNPVRAANRVSSFLHYDFCPGQNGWAYKLKHPLWAVATAAVAAGLVGISLNSAALWVAAALSVGGVLGVAWPWFAASGLDCTVEFDGRRGREGVPSTVILRVTNRLPVPAWGLAVAEGFGEVGEANLSLDRVPGWSTVEYRWTFTPPRRGVYPLAPPRLATGFPFGLWSASVPAEVTRRLVVWPQGEPVGHLPSADNPNPADDRLSDRDPGEFGELLGTRAFREGDSLRRVHWAQTARHRTLVVCERQAGRTATVRLRADLSAKSFGTAGDSRKQKSEEAVETAVRVTAGLCESLVRLGATVECSIEGAKYRLGADPAALRSVLDELAAVPRGGFGDDDERPRRAADRRGDGIVVTGPFGAASRGERAVRVSLDEPGSSAGTSSAASWLTVAPGAEKRFAADWRRACRVA